MKLFAFGLKLTSAIELGNVFKALKKIFNLKHSTRGAHLINK